MSGHRLGTSSSRRGSSNLGSRSDPASGVAAELAADDGAQRRPTHQAVTGREARLVDELKGDIAGEQRAAIQADPAAARETRAVEVVEARVQDRAPRHRARRLEGRDGVGPKARL